MTRKRTPAASGIVLMLALVIGGWLIQRGMGRSDAVVMEARLLDEIVDYIADLYVEEVDREQLYEYAIEGILEELGDPNTSVLDTSAYEDFRIQTEGDYGGLGIEITDRDEYITVVAPLPGTPAARAGIRTGDRIIEVAGEEARGWSVQEAVRMLRGSPGSSVDVVMERPGVEAPIPFTIKRERIRLRSVPFGLLLEDAVGYVPLRVFSETATREVRAVADSLLDEGATSLILDLRGNPGGVLDQGLGVADLFLPDGTDVVDTRGDDRGINGMLRASSEDHYEGVPLVVLVDRGSASASEIVAGSLQDHDRALLVGTSTFGKGSVQTLLYLPGGNMLKLTTARWFTPLGRSIERTGDGPDGENPPGGHLALDIMGRAALPADTAGRPVVTSSGGRPLFGGGGIVPDVLARVDTLSSDEQAAVRLLFEEAAGYSLARFDYAVRYLQERPASDDVPDFELTGAEAGELLALLEGDTDFEPGSGIFPDAQRFVEIDLELEIALQGWGEIGEFRRGVSYDAPLQAALGVLRGADSPEDLF